MVENEVESWSRKIEGRCAEGVSYCTVTKNNYQQEECAQSISKEITLKSSVLGVRPLTNKWVSAELNDMWEQLNEEFIMWFYYLMDLPEDPEVTTDEFRNFLLEYKNQPFVDKFINYRSC